MKNAYYAKWQQFVVQHFEAKNLKVKVNSTGLMLIGDPVLENLLIKLRI